MMPLVDVRNLVKEFTAGRAFGPRRAVRAVDDVSFSVERGEMFGLVGESGSGKTTTGRCLLRLIEPTSGQMFFDGRDVCQLRPRELRAARRNFQIVFQDPYSSLNPRMTVGTLLEEPLIVHHIGTAGERRARVSRLLDLVGLPAAAAAKYPHEFSGGQRQRIGLARALALEPSFIVADEPVSALDVSIQAQVINLLMDLQERLHLTYLFIAHDLRLVRQVCRRVAVMYRGRIVELGTADQVFAHPAHAYTQALLSATPSHEPGVTSQRIRYDGSSFERLSLREVGPGHLAAVGG